MGGPAQICSLLEVGLREAPLARLTSVALYMELGCEYGPEYTNPHFVFGHPYAPKEDAQSVCDALGRLVVAGVLPALAQVVSAPPATVSPAPC